MSWRAYRQLPHAMQNDITKFYHHSLSKKRIQLLLKRFFDIIASAFLLLLLSPLLLLTACFIKVDSKGKALFQQTRVKQYMDEFTIYKFRTMEDQHQGVGITCQEDSRITRVGRILRRFRLDELPQLYNILRGDMSFVGQRPELPKFVAHYTQEMCASFLLPVGLTCTASILFKDEAQTLGKENCEQTYIQDILPDKMSYNVAYLKDFSLMEDCRILIKTMLSILFPSA